MTRKETSLCIVFNAKLIRRIKWFRNCRSRFTKFVKFILMQQLLKSCNFFKGVWWYCRYKFKACDNGCGFFFFFFHGGCQLSGQYVSSMHLGVVHTCPHVIRSLRMHFAVKHEQSCSLSVVTHISPSCLSLRDIQCVYIWNASPHL